MAGYVCCVWSTALICRYLILHYFRGGQIISSLLSDRLTLKFLLALMVVMHETLNKVTDYNPRVNTEKQTETSAGEEKFL